MTKESHHSQDYDRKHGTDHNLKDKAALKEAFIDDLRKDTSRKDLDNLIRTPSERE